VFPSTQSDFAVGSNPVDDVGNLAGVSVVLMGGERVV
jgi:hypothetical protein